MLPGATTLVLFLYGSVPLKRHETPARSASNPAGLSLLTALLDEPTYYIVRDENGAIARIAEEKGARATERKIPILYRHAVCADRQAG